jgi:hypothetical protein
MPFKRKKWMFQRPDQSPAFPGFSVCDPDQPWPWQLASQYIHFARFGSHVASPFIVLHAHSMDNPIRTQSSFNITPWLGERFPSDCLRYPDLEFYCNSLRTIPHQCPVNYSFSVHLSVQQFLSSAFPSHSCSLVVEAASECFSNNPPTKILATLVEKDIPPYKFIQDLTSQFGQAILVLSSA